MNHREVILKCMEVNANYMRLPAGMLSDYQALVKLYQRIASQCLECAGAWVEEQPCPSHEPAVDAFMWSIVAWSDAFGRSIGVDMAEWSARFVGPHYQFAGYLKSGTQATLINSVAGPPAQVVMELDISWMNLGIRLTQAWGFRQHLKDRDALREARRLGRELARDSPVRKAYLESDLAFFQQLFKNFPFSEKTVARLSQWLRDLEVYTSGI